MNNLITGEEAQQIIEPHLQALFKIAHESKLDVSKAVQAMNQEVDKRTLAAMMSNCLKNKSRRYFRDQNVRVIEEYSTLQVIFESNNSIIAGRWKKTNRNRTVATNRTKRSNIISFQLALFPQRTTFVDFTYLMNITNTDIEAVSVTCRLGREIVWTFDVDGSASELGLATALTATSVQPRPTGIVRSKYRNKRQNE